MNKKIALLLLILILLLAAFMRLYRISDYMTFLGDEGRDVLVAKGILEGHLTLLGPRASAGDFFTGPIYYYMMTPFLWLFHLDPVGPAIMVALFGIATVLLIFYVSYKWFDYPTAVIASALYAVSPLVLMYSHSSWNPNTVPFFSLLTMYLLYKAVTTVRSWRYYLLVGVLLGICVQLHYISLFLGLIVAISLFGMQWYLHNRIQIIPIILNYLEIFVGFLIGFSPFLAFELRHNFQNIKAIMAFVTKDTTQAGYAMYHYFYEPIADVFFRLFARLVFAFPLPVDYEKYALITLQISGLVIILFAIASIIALLKHKNKFVVILLSVWLVVGVLLFGLYKKPIYDYYLVFAFPLPFLLIGNLFSKISTLKLGKVPYGIILAGLFFIVIFGYNLLQNPFQYPPNKQKDQTRRIATFVISKTDNKQFNFALITPGNSDHAYRYYLDILGHKPIQVDNPLNDPTRKTVTSQLMVICEGGPCNPEGNPLFDIAGFGPAKVAGSWDISVVKVYRLVHKK